MFVHSLYIGNKPAWDFATTFKIIVDDFLLRYLATDVVTLELNMVRYHNEHVKIKYVPF